MMLCKRFTVRVTKTGHPRVAWFNGL